MSLLSIRGITQRFGGVTALTDVSLDVEEGTIHGLIGPNGAGKTTLINIVSGLVRPTEGTLSFNGRENGPWPMAHAVTLGIVRTYQQTRVFMGLTARENLRIAHVAGAGDANAEDLIDALDLGSSLDRVAGELPYATLRRLSLALALGLRPKLLLLDEPAVGLAPDEIARMAEVIRHFHGQGLTVFLVEHNMRFLMELASRVSVFDRGRLLFEGTPEAAQGNPEVIEAYLGRGLKKHAGN
ncbi:amino acid/amide ABC transporter ATP-binding protein 1, HAAT family [Faunimonas pinastri]|uniref:Amino acid/amide ABC transporter ATP-binding protein 1, HAAT family n=1 Tax=Faunimonas pinastri TaxID=1855383 RepID=A0A1H9ECY3_9HYPH|nr:ATP-binding cassette domain-containing protein [Faunimonas pinastri]SEQ23531.1 amino acid/amide ABC transporter ATP-binding protein 1, HAAT family [Faunimonas pinastri]